MSTHNDNKALEEIDIREVIRVFWRGKWIIMAVTFIFAVFSVFYALSLPNLYTAYGKVAPTEESQAGSLGGMAEQLGGLASLAGVNLPRGEGDNAKIALEILNSRVFIADFVRRRGIVPEVMAAERWNPNSGELRYNEDSYDAATGTWVREVKPPRTVEPSDWEIVEAFREMLSIDTDDLSGFTNIAVEHPSPVLAKQWVEWLIEDINNQIRVRDVEEAERSLNFLETELENVNLANMQQVFYQMIEKQTYTIMMTRVRPEYVFRVIDPPVVSEEKTWPPRAFICIGITLFGALMTMVGLLIANMFRRDESLVD